MSLPLRNDSQFQPQPTAQPHNFSRPHPLPTPSSSASSGLNQSLDPPTWDSLGSDSDLHRYKTPDHQPSSLTSGRPGSHSSAYNMPPNSSASADANTVSYRLSGASATAPYDSSYLSPSADGSAIPHGYRSPVNGDAMRASPPLSYSNSAGLNAPGSLAPSGRVSSPPVPSTPSGGSGPSGQPLSVPAGPGGASALRHRHTLQVPKAQASRASTPGSSDAVTSGRFSPTSPQPRRASITLGRRPTRSLNSEIHLDEVPPDEDAARWAEAIKARRASKRRKQEEIDDDKVFVGTKVDHNHVNWVTAYNMLTGIRFVVSRVNAKMDRPLTDADFDAKHKFSFDVTGNELTPSAKYDFKFKDYSPWVFRHLRNKFRLDPADYLMSLTSKYILSELGSPGKSGSFFYFSRDYKYIIKTIHHAEHRFLRHILREYYTHVEENPNTLISQFYGLHRVKTPFGRKIHFVVMNNLFPPHRDIHQTFDLKGSTIGRDFREEDLEENPRATLKDLNWLRRDMHLEFGPEKKDAFIKQVERDVELLKKLEIMDYSLLVGIHDLTRGNKDDIRNNALKVFQPGGVENEELQGHILQRTPSKMEKARQARELRKIINKEVPVTLDRSANRLPEEFLEQKNTIFYGDDGGFRATHETDEPGDVVYYLGIIDCLTHYGFIKRLEHFWRGISNPKDRISAIPPSNYGDRFFKFITGLVKSPEEAAREMAIRESAGAEGLETQQQSSGNDVLERAQRDAEKSTRHSAVENERPTRSMATIRSPSAERTNGAQGAILPVVEEAGEGSSSGAGRHSQNGSLTTSISDSGRGGSFTDGGMPDEYRYRERSSEEQHLKKQRPPHREPPAVPISFSATPILPKHHSEDMAIRVARVSS